MRAVLALAFACLLFGCASEPWDSTDRVLGVTALGASVIDWGQARSIAKHPAQFEEANPILGKHPSREKVDAYFIGVIGGGYLVADMLSPGYRKLLLGGAVIVEISAVRHNRSIGVGFSF
jgi:hypothetical protein